MPYYIDSVKLIEAVKRRPGLYNKGDEIYYNNKKEKSKLWIEVCKEVYSNWDQRRPQDRLDLCHKVQKRWKSLRTGFTRELQTQKIKKQRHEEDGTPIKRRKRYAHFNAMSFLHEPCVIQKSEGVTETDDDSFDPLDVKSESAYEESALVWNNSHKIMMEGHETLPVEKYYDRQDTFDGEALEILREIKRDEEDEDRQFILSLVPCFRKLKDKQKFEARIQILRALKDISFIENE